MRRIHSAIFLVIVLLTMFIQGCGNKGITTGFTSDLPVHQSSKGFLVETENGYYCCDGKFFYYSDRDNINFQKLCDKLQCPHEDKDCNAWSFGTNKVHFFNGRLTFSYREENAGKQELVVASKKADGSETKTLSRIEIPSIMTFVDGYMHRNWYAYNVVVFDEEQENEVTTLYLLDLKHPKKSPEVILQDVVDNDVQNASIYLNSWVGKIMYFDYNGEKYRYDTESRECVVLPSDPYGTKGEYYTEDMIYKMDIENNLYKINVEANTKTNLVKDDEVFGPFFSDGTYLYRLNYSYGNITVAEDDNGIYIYDMDGKRITYVKYSLPTDYRVYFVSASDRVFVFRLDDLWNVVSYSYFEKSNIESGQCVWTDVMKENRQ